MGITERKEREREQRRGAIIDAAEKVFFSKGIENATMDEVAQKAELSKGTLYLYFKNKNELLHGIIGRGLEILLTMFKGAVKKKKKGFDKIKAIGQSYYEFYKKEPDYFTAMLHQDTHEIDPQLMETSPNYTRCKELGDGIFALIREAVTTGIADGTVRRDLEPAKLSLVLWGHTSGMLNITKTKEKVIKDMFNMDEKEIIEYSHRLIEDYLVDKTRKDEKLK